MNIHILEYKLGINPQDSSMDYVSVRLGVVADEDLAKVTCPVCSDVQPSKEFEIHLTGELGKLATKFDPEVVSSIIEDALMDELDPNHVALLIGFNRFLLKAGGRTVVIGDKEISLPVVDTNREAEAFKRYERQEEN